MYDMLENFSLWRIKFAQNIYLVSHVNFAIIFFVNFNVHIKHHKVWAIKLFAHVSYSMVAKDLYMGKFHL